MILHDARTPKGRIVPMPPPPSPIADLLEALACGCGVEWWSYHTPESCPSNPSTLVNRERQWHRKVDR